MEVTVLEQTISFLYSSLTGFLLGMIYEFFRCFKITLVKNKIIKDIIDVTFVLVCAVFLFFSFFSICALSFRLYHVVGFLLGIIIYFTSVNRVIYKIFEKIFVVFKEILKILLYPVKFFSKMIWRVLCYVLQIVMIPVKYINNFFIRLKNSVKNILKRKKRV